MGGCPKCGAVNAAEARFCSACGHELSGAPEREVRKTVTVLFADVTGSTALGERTDPETLRRVMERYFDDMREVIESHGGTVEKFIGDAVMAVFGIPVVHEDDALRAVRAAVDMRTSLARLNEELERDLGIRIAVRTGVNTGQVIAGDAADAQNFVVGDPVNVAARLEQSAAPDEILLGATTYRLVRDAVRVEPVAPLELKGKSEKTAAYRVLSVDAAAPGTTRRLDSQLVGRDSELEKLKQEYLAASRDSECRLVTVVGSAGLGKSRLIAEFLDGVTGATTATGRCLSYGDGITFWPIAEIVKELAGIGDDEPDLARSKIHALVASDGEADLVTSRISGLMGFEESAGSLEETFWAVRRFFETVARNTPLVLVFDDIHWAETTLLDLLEHLVLSAHGSPMLVIGVARPELMDVRPGWGSGLVRAEVVTLEALTADQSDALLENLLGGSALPPDLTRRIRDAAEGTPLFVEEMFSMLLDDGVLERGPEGWTLVHDVQRIAVPPTIEALLTARLDQLSQTERTVIGTASVVGKVFWGGAVAALCDSGSVSRELMMLARKELIQSERSTFAGQDAYTFRHILIRDAAYESLPKKRRAELHEAFVAWLERAADTAHDLDEIAAYHLETAYAYAKELGPITDRERAVGERAALGLALAGRRALGRGDVNATLTLLERALVLPWRHDADRWSISIDLAEALIEAGRLDDAMKLTLEVLNEADEAGDEVSKAHAEVMRTWICFMLGEVGTTRSSEEAKRLLETFESADDARGAARAWMLLAYANLVACQIGASAEAWERVIDLAEMSDYKKIAMDAAAWLIRCEVLGRSPHHELLDRIEQHEARVPDSRIVAAAALMARGFVSAVDGDFTTGRRLHNEGIQVLHDMGLKLQAGAMAYDLATAELWAGHLDEAERVMKEGYDILEALGEKAYASTHAAELAGMAFARGDLEAAQHYVDVSDEASSEEDIASRSKTKSVRAKLAVARGDRDAALSLARESVDLIIGSDADAIVAMVLMEFADTLEMLGDLEEARAALDEARARVASTGNQLVMRKVESRAEKLLQRT